MVLTIRDRNFHHSGQLLRIDSSKNTEQCGFACLANFLTLNQTPFIYWNFESCLWFFIIIISRTLEIKLFAQVFGGYLQMPRVNFQRNFNFPQPYSWILVHNKNSKFLFWRRKNPVKQRISTITAQRIHTVHNFLHTFWNRILIGTQV